jgi:ParB-like chromosome segregation protein Spo0J
MEGAEFDQFVKDIEENDQRDPIVVHPDDGRILDGRNRERACLKLGIKPVIAIWDREPGGDELKFVLSRNLHRRHLDTSQRALIGAQIANMRRGKTSTREGLQICRPASPVRRLLR